MRKLISLPLFILFVFALSSCGDGESSCSDLLASGTVPFQSQLSAYEAATLKYSSNPTMENCETLVSTGLAYISALQEYQNCVNPTERNQFAASLQSAEDSIDSIDCN